MTDIHDGAGKVQAAGERVEQQVQANTNKVSTALVSVSDKTGVVEFCRGLAALGIKILSTGGTARALRDAGLEVVDVSQHTGSPEILDGRVKTLHPRVHGGILARRQDASHREQVEANGIEYIDLVCVNLYPFAEVTARDCSFEEAIENIDIGGPSMVRSAAKNHADVALKLVSEFEQPACMVIKHTNPCGAALAGSAAEAFRLARSCDPVSIFGGIVALNRELDGETAELMKEVFLEIVLAPSFSDEALALYSSTKKLANVRLLEVDSALLGGEQALDMKRVLGGLLVQTRDLEPSVAADCRVVSARKPSAAELEAMDFAWKVCKHAKSNTIVLAHGDHVAGVGAGQMSRVDSARIAVARAAEHGLDTVGTVVASDAFFPFPDGLQVCADAGATAVIQPGGSMRDDEIIKAADAAGMAMVLTGVRHFRH